VLLLLFRFYGRIADEPYCHSDDILNAIRSNVSGLANISGERLWSELKKILEGKYAGELVVAMFQLGISEYLGMYGLWNTFQYCIKH
jgi:tRNA nucleotidyltransferase (CCA-adding enzyme)